ncbi:type II toxin-antitoxin system RelB family antitoxin [Caballeronia grimmiae]|uniref:type II toxin-antitoxin system RelB family antitoxin n=1 Tax=Caballeronia grimmiae TaxID=1071679 RepID=UPI0038B6E79F
MKTLDVSQATAAAQSGGVLSAILRADGGQFFVELETRTAGIAVLVTSNNRRPRAFRNPVKALEVIRELGLQTGRFSLEAWRPDEAEFERPSRPDRAEAMKQTHSNAAAYEKWFREQVQESLDDPRPNVPHAQVQKEMAEKKAALRRKIAASEAKS